jgi:hypothetical protein
MGCHTWCYKKVERSLEEAVLTAKETLHNNIKQLEDSKDRGTVGYQAAIKWYKKFLDNIDNGIYELEEDLFEGNECTILYTGSREDYLPTTIWGFQPEDSEFIEGKGFYVECGDLHDIFRVWGYPEDKLFSKEECLEFIAKFEK